MIKYVELIIQDLRVKPDVVPDSRIELIFL